MKIRRVTTNLGGLKRSDMNHVNVEYKIESISERKTLKSKINNQMEIT